MGALPALIGRIDLISIDLIPALQPLEVVGTYAKIDAFERMTRPHVWQM
jgi:hypothetical protein